MVRTRPQAGHRRRRLCAERVRSLTVVCETNGSARPPALWPPAPLGTLNEPMFARRLVTRRRRLFVRVPLERPLEFWTESDDFLLGAEGNGRDISLGGMFVETDIPCRFGERALVRLTLPKCRHQLALVGIVRWTCRDGMGMQFGRLGARNTHEILAFTMQWADGDCGS